MSATEEAAIPAGPDERVSITEGYARLVARDAFLWTWPLVNIYSRRLKFKDLPEAGLSGGIVPIAPSNRLSMLTDYIEPEERHVACPNQDVVYGLALLALDQSPMVVQVPDFGDRFWVYQIVDLRTDSFAFLGKMYGTPPGHYLLVGPDWSGDVPEGIAGVFRSPTQTGVFIPRVFQDDAPEDKRAVQDALSGIDAYPLAEFDGTPKRRDWNALPQFAAEAHGDTETKWVLPDRIFDVLPLVLDDAPPLPGEEARYAQLRAVLAAAESDAELKRAMIDEATKADQDLIDPMFQFRNWGIRLPHHWSSTNNNANAGTDYFTRTALAKSNIFVNKVNETKYFYQDLDSAGGRLNGSKRYAITFPAGQLPPVSGFWSLTLYNQYHFFHPNDLRRYSLGTKNKNLKYNADGSLTLHVQADAPEAEKTDNWLPAPSGDDFSLYLRSYWPKTEIVEGAWVPPPVELVS